MKRGLLYAVVVFSLVGFGWVVGKAQTAMPDFELEIESPSGATSIECIRGCSLTWVQRGINPNATPTDKFSFSCTAARCESGRLGGWIRP
jgi:hypothetical protein